MLSADADDDEGIAELRFFVDGERVATLGRRPYAAVVTPALAGPTALVAATAIDLAGNETRTAVLVRAGQEAPSLPPAETSGRSGGCAQVPGDGPSSPWPVALALFLVARRRMRRAAGESSG